MVDLQPLSAAQSEKPNYIIEEQSLISKTRNPEDCEDLIHISPSFVAVIDGTTSKTAHRWEGRTGGQVCAQLIDQILTRLPGDVTAREAVNAITARVKDFYEEHDVLELVEKDPSQRATAALLVASLRRREIWFVGDCQCMLDRHLVQNTKPVDDITAQARAMFLETELQKGTTIEELRRKDTGREFILPLLKQQQLFQNNPAAGTYWYPIIDGFPVPNEGIRIESIPQKTRTIILASDGYPVLKDSLEASEQELQRILESDPLLFRSYKATKGLQDDNVSYDDRAYIKLRLVREDKKENSATVRENGFNKPAKKQRKKQKSGKRRR